MDVSVGFTLLLITDPSRDVVADAAAALRDVPPGRVALMLRDPASDAAALLAEATALRALCTERGAKLLVNGDLRVARAAGADGAHLPERGPSVAEARAALGPDHLVGRSRHDAAGLREHGGADYLVLSPVGPVPGKGAPLGVDGFARAVAGVQRPVFALGGVTERDAGALRRAGAAGLAVRRAVFDAARPAEAVRSILRAFDEARP